MYQKEAQLCIGDCKRCDYNSVWTKGAFNLTDEIAFDNIYDDEDNIIFSDFVNGILEILIDENDIFAIRSIITTLYEVTDSEQTENFEKAGHCDALLITYAKELRNYLKRNNGGIS